MKLVVGNLKMNLNIGEIHDYVEFFKNKKYNNVIFAPSSIYLSLFVESGFKVCAQDVSFTINGAYTGDVSASQLKAIGVNYSIIGHSERRKYYDDDKYVNNKLQRLLEQNMIPILCIGEKKEERDKNITLKVLKDEIDDSFKNIDTNLLNSVIIAYEPIWSIGTGIILTNNDITETIKYIKEYIKNQYNLDIKVLYGGSVNNSNIMELEKISIIDGYLVGGCSIKKEDFDKLINSIE